MACASCAKTIKRLEEIERLVFSLRAEITLTHAKVADVAPKKDPPRKSRKKVVKKRKKVPENTSDKAKVLRSKLTRIISKIDEEGVPEKALKVRRQLAHHVDYEEGMNLVDEHLKNYKMKLGKLTKTKTKSLHSSLSPLEMREKGIDGYHEYDLVSWDLKVCRGWIYNRKRSEPPLSLDWVFQPFFTYASVALSVITVLELSLVDDMKGALQSIIYVGDKGVRDPFAFYTLEKIENGRRSWTMDCRLETLTGEFVHRVRMHLIQRFRDCYMAVFHDNVYRENYRSHSTFCEVDLEQLLMNIKLLFDFNRLCIEVRRMVMKRCYYEPSDIDDFNLTGDDKIQKTRLSKPFQREEKHKEIFNALFDEGDIDDFLNKMI